MVIDAKTEVKMSKISKTPKLPNLQIGRIGEYSVAAELEKRGYTTTLTMNNTNYIDILGFNDDGKQIMVQVKTTMNPTWALDIKKIPSKMLKKIVFVFVKIKSDFTKEYHIVKGQNVQLGIENYKVSTWSDKNNRYLDKWNNL